MGSFRGMKAIGDAVGHAPSDVFGEGILRDDKARFHERRGWGVGAGAGRLRGGRRAAAGSGRGDVRCGAGRAFSSPCGADQPHSAPLLASARSIRLAPPRRLGCGRHVELSPAFRRAERRGDALRRRARQGGVRVVGPGRDSMEGGLAEMDAAGRNDRAEPQSGALERTPWRYAAWPQEPAGRAGALYFSERAGHAVPRARHAGPVQHWKSGLGWMRADDQSGRRRPVSARSVSARIFVV